MRNREDFEHFQHQQQLAPRIFSVCPIRLYILCCLLSFYRFKLSFLELLFPFSFLSSFCHFSQLLAKEVRNYNVTSAFCTANLPFVDDSKKKDRSELSERITELWKSFKWSFTSTWWWFLLHQRLSSLIIRLMWIAAAFSLEHLHTHYLHYKHLKGLSTSIEHQQMDRTHLHEGPVVDVTHSPVTVSGSVQGQVSLVQHCCARRAPMAFSNLITLNFICSSLQWLDLSIRLLFLFFSPRLGTLFYSSLCPSANVSVCPVPSIWAPLTGNIQFIFKCNANFSVQLSFKLA